MTQDILEQMVDDWFRRRPGVFTKTNVKYRPDISTFDKKIKHFYSVHSDIDVIAIDRKARGVKKVSVVTCKSWQIGFDIKKLYTNLNGPRKRKRNYGSGPYWKKFRELVDPVWAEAFRNKIFEETGIRNFTYYIAVTKAKNESFKTKFCEDEEFLGNLTYKGHKVEIKFLLLADILNELSSNPQKSTVESTHMARTIQVIRAAGFEFTQTTRNVKKE